MSYFHEYFHYGGKKNLRRYSRPLDLNTFKSSWPIAGDDLWFIDKKLDQIKHYKIAPDRVYKKLRLADMIEREAIKIVEFTPSNRK